MLPVEKALLEQYRSLSVATTLVFAAVKFGVAYALITYFEYGLFVVVGYLLYSAESLAVRQFINAHETNYQLNVLNHKSYDASSSEIQDQIEAMKERIEHLEDTVESLTNQDEYEP